MKASLFSLLLMKTTKAFAFSSLVTSSVFRTEMHLLIEKSLLLAASFSLARCVSSSSTSLAQHAASSYAYLA